MYPQRKHVIKRNSSMPIQTTLFKLDVNRFAHRDNSNSIEIESKKGEERRRTMEQNSKQRKPVLQHLTLKLVLPTTRTQIQHLNQVSANQEAVKRSKLQIKVTKSEKFIPPRRLDGLKESNTGKCRARTRKWLFVPPQEPKFGK